MLLYVDRQAIVAVRRKMLLLCVDWQAIVAQRWKMLLLGAELQVKTGKNRTTRTDREEPNPVDAILYGYSRGFVLNT